MSLYLARAEITANTWGTDWPGKAWVKVDGSLSQRGSPGDWLQTSGLGHWLDLAAPMCGREEPEGRKSEQTVVLHIWDAKLSAATLIYGCPPTAIHFSHGCLRCVGTVVPQPVPWTVSRNWSSIQKLISFFFFFSLSGSRGQLLAWSWLCCYPGCSAKPQFTVRGPEQTNGSFLFAHWLMHSM